jgi:hypothetical protein
MSLCYFFSFHSHAAECSVVLAPQHLSLILTGLPCSFKRLARGVPCAPHVACGQSLVNS